MKQRKRGILVLAAMLCALLSGCAMSISADELYALPRLPAEYGSLEEQINALLADGAEHAAPSSGSNLQSVQMIDLDGDGVEEAVAFFRKADDAKPMKIYLFKSDGETYRRLALIEGTASSVYSISYPDLDGDGQCELLIGYKSGTELQALSVYALRRGEALNLLTTLYLRYAVSDLDGDGRDELTVFYSGEENRCAADCYVWNSTELTCLSTAELSFSASELSRVSAGRLSDGADALYVTGVTDNSAAVCDILTLRSGVLCCAVQGAASRFLSLYPTDIDGDGVIEVPEPLPFPQLTEESEIYYRILWRAYSSSGSSEVVRRTYHNTADGWSFVLPEAWENGVSLLRSSTAGESSVLFFALAGETPRPFLEICALTGEDSEQHAMRGDRFVLARQVDAVYTAELLPYDWDGQLDESAVREAFSLIVAEWTTGEN